MRQQYGIKNARKLREKTKMAKVILTLAIATLLTASCARMGYGSYTNKMVILDVYKNAEVWTFPEDTYRFIIKTEDGAVRFIQTTSFKEPKIITDELIFTDELDHPSPVQPDRF